MKSAYPAFSISACAAASIAQTGLPVHAAAMAASFAALAADHSRICSAEGVPQNQVRSFSIVRPLRRGMTMFTSTSPSLIRAPHDAPSPCGEADAGPLKVQQRMTSKCSPGKRSAASCTNSDAIAKSSSCTSRPGRMFSR
ncbi:hypothetical protein D9M68_785870 [compost metagenome]